MSLARSLKPLVVFAAAASLLLTLEPVSAQKRGGTFVMIVQPEPPTLASYLSTAGPIGQVTAKVYDGLVEYDFDLRPIPGLAESWTIAPDGRMITFKLQKGVRFHDGKPFTSADVKFTVLEVLKKYHPFGASTFRELEAIDTPDEHTAVFRLKNTAPYLMMALSARESPMLPRHLFEGTDIQNHPNANSPIGTGPFKFVEWRRGQFVHLDRNPSYWRSGRPYLDRIVARFIPDSATRAAAMERGEAHVAGLAAIYYSDVRRLEKLPHIEVTARGYELLSPIVELYFNTQRPPFDNPKVRQAIAYAIDRKFVIDNIWFGFGKVATGPISSNFTPAGWYTPEVRNYTVPNGLELANKLLDEAGYRRGPGGIRFEAVHDLTPYGEEWRRFGEYMQQVMERLGIKVTLRYEDVPTWLRRIFTSYDFQITSNWIFNLADPALGVHREYHSKAIRPGVVFQNAARWSSPRTDELMDQAAVVMEPKKRAALYKELQQLVVEASAVIWTHEIQFTTVLNRNYKDVIVGPLGVYGSFDRAHLAK
jgi:peptide/nickel transport system substrate-binding protein